MAKKPNTKSKLKAGLKRNGALYDTWSLIHFSTGVAMGWLISPVIALALMVLYEPFEIFVLSPILGRFGIVFGFESLRNSLSDIFFDTLGVAAGYLALTALIDPPFHLF